VWQHNNNNNNKKCENEERTSSESNPDTHFLVARMEPTHSPGTTQPILTISSTSATTTYSTNPQALSPPHTPPPHLPNPPSPPDCVEAKPNRQDNKANVPRLESHRSKGTRKTHRKQRKNTLHPTLKIFQLHHQHKRSHTTKVESNF